MKRFDICPAQGHGIKGRERLVVVLQHEHFSDLASTVVAPLYLQNELPQIEVLRPALKVGRKRYVVAVDRLASMPKVELGASVASAGTIHFELLRAVDRLFSGF